MKMYAELMDKKLSENILNAVYLEKEDLPIATSLKTLNPNVDWPLKLSSRKSLNLIELDLD